METTREEREREYAEAEKVLAMDDPAFPPAVRARQNAHADYLMRLCCDVDTALGALEKTHGEVARVLGGDGVNEHARISLMIAYDTARVVLDSDGAKEGDASLHVAGGEAVVDGKRAWEAAPSLAAVCPWCLWELHAVREAAHSWVITGCTATEHTLGLYDESDPFQLSPARAVLKLAKPAPRSA